MAEMVLSMARPLVGSAINKAVEAAAAEMSLLMGLMKLKDRHRIAIQIRNLKSRVEEVSNRNTRYSLISPNPDENATIDNIRNFSTKNIDEAELVVSQSFDRKELLGALSKQLLGDGSKSKHLRDHQEITRACKGTRKWKTSWMT
uniref:Rx N-terminal domain-containing protein n=1 Tax=Leersia perrieri TaxID=77586 RepID=A0A0D9WPD6_9ORYZ